MQVGVAAKHVEEELAARGFLTTGAADVPAPAGEAHVTDKDGDGPKPSKASNQAIFKKVCAKLRTKLGQDVFNSWFGRLQLDEVSGGVVRLSVPTPFLRSWINEKYLTEIFELWQQHSKDVLKIDIAVRSAFRRTDNTTSEGSKGDARPGPGGRSTGKFAGGTTGSGPKAPFLKNESRSGAKPARKTLDGSAVDPRYTFSTLVEGPSNRVCVAAAKAAVEDSTAAARFNPLFFYSNVGLGKTHLLQAIANESRRTDPTKRVVYLTAEYFMYAFASAIRDNNALTLKQSLQDIELLIIDDMQFLQGEKIQSEFCHLINALLDSARRVVAAADRPPSELESLDPRVRSRLQGGVALGIDAPDYEMRLAMLRERLADARREDHTLAIDDEVLQHVAQTVSSSFRELEGAFNQLIFRHSVEPDITLDRVNDILSHLLRTDERKKVRIEDIQRVVSQHYEVARNELLSNRRTRKIVRPRQIAMYLAKQLTPRSLPEIGRRFGGRDHTTVLHAVRKVESMKREDGTLAKEIELLRRLIEE